MRARVNLGALLAPSDPQAALAIARAGLAESRRLGHRRQALVLLTNAAEVAVWTGDWDLTLPEFEELLAGDLDREDRIIVLGRLVLIGSWQGDLVDGLVDEIVRLVGDTSEPAILISAEVARADRAFAIGMLEDAAQSYRRAAVMTAEYAPVCYVLAARASLLAHDAASAAADLDGLDATGLHGPAIEARRASIRAGLAALDGRPSDALALYRDAIRRFRDLGLPIDEAFTAIEMATLLGPAEPEVRVAAEAAREILTRLEAKPFLERLEEATKRQSPTPASERTRPQDASRV